MSRWSVVYLFSVATRLLRRKDYGELHSMPACIAASSDAIGIHSAKECHMRQHNWPLQHVTQHSPYINKDSQSSLLSDLCTNAAHLPPRTTPSFCTRTSPSLFFSWKWGLGPMLNPVMRRLLLGIALALVLLSYFFFKERLGEFGITAADRPFGDAVKPDRGMLSDIKKWQRESQIRRIVGLVFYGRRSQASILDCYLKVSRYATPFSFPLVSIKSRSVKSRIRAVIGIRR